jgi:CubicO group peptidase (beta-lactamase class C family)
MKSVSKSVASLALGIAIDRGLIRSVDDRSSASSPSCRTCVPRKDRLRLAHALTMTMGLKWWKRPRTTGQQRGRMHRAPDPCRYVLGLRRRTRRTEFFYSTGTLTLVSAIVRKATGHPLDDLPGQRCSSRWAYRRGVDSGQGDTDAGGDFACGHATWRISQLVLAGGRWNSRQVVSKAWIDASMTPRIGATSLFSMDISGGSALPAQWA